MLVGCFASSIAHNRSDDRIDRKYIEKAKFCPIGFKFEIGNPGSLLSRVQKRFGRLIRS